MISQSIGIRMTYYLTWKNESRHNREASNTTNGSFSDEVSDPIHAQH
jgi:hypothetical protein